MPSPALDVQQFEPVLKNVYLNVRKKVFPINVVGLALARKIGPDKVTYAGRDLFFDVKFGRRGGFVSSTAGFLPYAKLSREKQGRLSIARTYARVAVDGLNTRVTASDRGSFVSAAKKVVEDVMDQWEIEQERILHGDSLGIRALVTSGVASASQTVDSPYGISGSGPGGLHLEPGDDVAFLSPDGLTLRGKRRILTITHSGDVATLVLDSSVTTTTGDVVVTAVPAAVDSTDSSFGAEPHGWKSIMDVENAFGTFEGLNDPRWVAQKLSSTTVDETIIMRLLNTIRARSGVDTRKDPRNMALITTTGIWQTYGESLLGLRRFAAPEMTLNGGFTGVKVANATLIDDPWAPRGRLYAIYGPDTVFIDLMDFGMQSIQGSPRWNMIDNQDAAQATFAAYWNYGAYNRSSMGVISGIVDTVNYSPVF